jgi:hypothetical protein
MVFTNQCADHVLAWLAEAAPKFLRLISSLMGYAAHLLKGHYKKPTGLYTQIVTGIAVFITQRSVKSLGTFGFKVKSFADSIEVIY